jgi:uncharacterized protein
MTDSIREKLDMYKCFSRKTRGSSFTEKDSRSIYEGDILSNDQGSCLVVENVYPLSYVRGGYSLGKALGYDTSYLELISGGCKGCGDISDFIFLDTETTGLSGGAGTVAFLTGAGFFTDDAFVVRQYFMRDYDEEPAMLEYLNMLLKERQGLVTFNGRSFDWNILRSRYVYNRMKPVVSEPHHIDLLYPSRRIWKLKLESCRLSSLEENILGEYRVNDIPGEQIPSAYFEYLDTGRFDTMQKVLEHNREDILSMVSLLIRICAILTDPLNESDGSFELLGAGTIFENACGSSRVVECLEACVNSGSARVRHTALLKLSGIYKRNNEYEKAVLHWREHADGREAASRAFTA